MKGLLTRRAAGALLLASLLPPLPAAAQAQQPDAKGAPLRLVVPLSAGSRSTPSRARWAATWRGRPAIRW